MILAHIAGTDNGLIAGFSRDVPAQTSFERSDPGKAIQANHGTQDPLYLYLP